MFSVFIRFSVSRRRIRRNREVQTRVLINVPSRWLQIYYSTIWRTCQYTLCSFRFYHNDLEYFLCIITYTWKNHAFAPFIADIFSRFSARFWWRIDERHKVVSKPHIFCGNSFAFWNTVDLSTAHYVEELSTHFNCNFRHILQITCNGLHIGRMLLLQCKLLSQPHGCQLNPSVPSGHLP